MTKYVALLRGIGPLNPNMRNEKLRGVFEDLGFSNVRSVISTGNILFESSSKNIKEFEAKIEEAWPSRLGFTSTTIIRSRKELQRIIDKDPFKGMEHSHKSSLNVTFLKNKPEVPLKTPFYSKKKDYTVLKMYEREICSVIDTTSAKTPDLMAWLEKQFGKEITTRTWKTLEKIVQKFE